MHVNKFYLFVGESRRPTRAASERDKRTTREGERPASYKCLKIKMELNT